MADHKSHIQKILDKADSFVPVMLGAPVVEIAPGVRFDFEFRPPPQFKSCRMDSLIFAAPDDESALLQLCRIWGGALHWGCERADTGTPIRLPYSRFQSSSFFREKDADPVRSFVFSRALTLGVTVINPNARAVRVWAILHGVGSVDYSNVAG